MPERRHHTSRKINKTNCVIVFLAGMSFVFFDAEARFVPEQGNIPVSEVSLLAVDANGFMVQEYHSLVNTLDIKPASAYETHLSEQVLRHVTGLSDQMLQSRGISAETMTCILREWSRKYINSTWVARDPILENRILCQYGCNSVVVQEVIPRVTLIWQQYLYRTKTRPLHIKQWSRQFACPHHDNPLHHHCARSDVWEEYGWVFKL